MVNPPARFAAIALFGVCLSATAQTVSGFLVSSYVEVSPTVWKGSGESFPEASELGARREYGVAFSGGGARSAAATVGQLRGLAHNGWLDRFGYVSAVSGGAWAAVPFVYSVTDLDVLLGPYREPSQIECATVETPAAEHSLARSIAEPKFLAASAPEVAKILGRGVLDNLDLRSEVAKFVRKMIQGSNDETFADVLGRLFIEPHVPGGATKLYTWNRKERDRIRSLNDGLSAGDFVIPAEGRPFLIVGGSIILDHQAYNYPRLVPVEMTPLYTGIRQQYGSDLGGTYVSPYAYNVASAGPIHDGLVRVRAAEVSHPFTLAEAVATSSGAPLLFIYRQRAVRAAALATSYFPRFSTFSIRGGQAGRTLDAQPHGDGGFTDNLGIMSLLARKVHNILVFVNSADALKDNPAVESLFGLLDRQEDLGGDRAINTVFDLEHFSELEKGLEQSVSAGGAATFCAQWRVLANEFYNIPSYEGLHICWVNNQPIPAWRVQLPAETQALLDTRAFKTFPLFSTYDVRLSHAQVNLLAELSAWTITNSGSRAAIANALSLSR